MKNRRLVEGPNRCKSKRHKEVWSQLKKQFPGYRIYNEYPYWNIVSSNDFTGSPFVQKTRLRADIFIKDVSIVIEVMGEQHYIPVAFGGDGEQAKQDLLKQRRRDSEKRQFSIDASFYLLELPYYVEVPNKVNWLGIFADVVKAKETGPMIITGDNESGYEVCPIDLEGTMIQGDKTSM